MKQLKAKFGSRKAYFNRNKGNPSLGWIAKGRYPRKYISINGKEMLESRYIMEQKLNRPLKPDEFVHHKDENRLNNDIANLELTDITRHNKNHNKNYIIIRSPSGKILTREKIN